MMQKPIPQGRLCRLAGALFGGIGLLTLATSGFAADDVLIEWRQAGPPQQPPYISDWSIVEKLPGDSYLLRPPAALNNDTWQQLLQRLQADPAIRHATPNKRIRLLEDAVANQAEAGWHLDDIGFDPALATAAGEAQIIAVIDSGLPPQALHTEAFRSDLLLLGYDFIKGNTDPTDHEQKSCGSGGDPKNWHGTAVTSIISSLAKQEESYLGGITGKKEETTTPLHIRPLRALDACGGDTSTLIKAIDKALSAAPSTDIINMSLGVAGACSPVLQKTVNQAIAKDILLVAAAGNDFTPATLITPSNCVGVLSVTGHNYNGESFATNTEDSSISAFAYGRSSDISAPGFHIHALDVKTENTPTQLDYAKVFGGTSMATPIISAIAGLLRRHRPNTSLANLSAALKAGEEHPPQADLAQSIARLKSGTVTPDPEIAFIQKYSQKSSNILQEMPFLGRRADPLFKAARKLSAETFSNSFIPFPNTIPALPLTAHAAAAFQINKLPSKAGQITLRITTDQPLLACLYHASGERLSCSEHKLGSVPKSFQLSRSVSADRRTWNENRQGITQWPDELQDQDEFSYYLIIEAIKTTANPPTEIAEANYSLQYRLQESAGEIGSVVASGGIGGGVWLFLPLCWPLWRRKLQDKGFHGMLDNALSATMMKIRQELYRRRLARTLLGGMALLSVSLTAFAADDLLLEWRHAGPPQLPSYISDWTIVEALPGNSYLVRPPAALNHDTWQQLLQRLQEDPAIRHASPNSKIRPLNSGGSGGGMWLLATLCWPLLRIRRAVKKSKNRPFSRETAEQK